MDIMSIDDNQNVSSYWSFCLLTFI